MIKLLILYFISTFLILYTIFYSFAVSLKALWKDFKYDLSLEKLFNYLICSALCNFSGIYNDLSKLENKTLALIIIYKYTFYLSSFLISFPFI
jgi:hypothetical protein